ncbi:MAG: hypothetical protein LBK03_01800 [Bacteroidales bacterium]|jgi:RHS repeat-associated protein|nr:hypothetical protein [Bacteroidales bacterium]
MRNNLPIGLIIGGLSLSIALLNIESPKQSDYSGGYMPSARGNASYNPIHDKGDKTGTLLAARSEHTPANAADEAGTAAFAYNFGEASIFGAAGALSQKTELSITGLADRELPPLEQGMVNVTGDYAAYRMLPHGTQFNSDIDIVLPYDTTLLPIGYTPADIMTYYYDELRRQWVIIPRDTVDETNRLVYSKVNHFTDFINAIIKSPEMPETQAYTPTSIKDLKAANPLEGIALIQPPTANSSGTANLSYPIDIPAGRQGMQPSLAITYSSGGGNGWLGIGWDLSVPAITVETRWGVPRYDAAQESEVYLLDGQPLATKNSNGEYDPLGYRAPWVARISGNVEYYPYTEGAFKKIIRHGTSPKSYWWEVRDKNGLIYYYGRTEKGNVDPNATLRDHNENIAKWGLTEIRDLNGNYIRFTHEIAARNIGKAMYIKEIAYTGHDRSPASYKIEFERIRRDAAGCKDITFHGRYGFMEVTNDLLYKIKVKHNDALIKEYKLSYHNNGKKTLLTAINESSYNERYPSSGTGEVHTVSHTFEYYPETISFGNETTINTGNDADALIGDYADSALHSSYSSAETDETGKLESKVKRPGSILEKGTDATSTTASTSTSDEEVLMLTDIDGDNLPDKVFRNRQNDKVYYRKLHFENGELFFAPQPTPVMVEDNVNSSSNPNHIPYYNLARITNGSGYPTTVSGAVSSYSKNKITSLAFSASSGDHFLVQYLKDVDGDKIPDLVKDGQVFYNRVDETGRYFAKYAGTIPMSRDCQFSQISNDVAVDAAMFQGNDTVIREIIEIDERGQENILTDTVITSAQEKAPQTYDAVRVWTAPYSGNIKIKGNAILSDSLLEEQVAHDILDGVDILIQHNSALIFNKPLNSLSPNLIIDTVNTLSFFINRGDRLYFRLGSKESSMLDKVTWIPAIFYNSVVVNGALLPADTNSRDANGRYIYRFNAHDDFLINPKTVYSMPYTGTIIVESSLLFSDTLSDDLSIYITRNGEQVYGPVEYGANSHNTGTSFSFSLDVTQKDTLCFMAEAATEINWNALKWDLNYEYIVLDEEYGISVQEETEEEGVFAPAVRAEHLIPYLTTYPQPVFPTAVYRPAANEILSQITATLTGATDNDNVTLSIKGTDGSVVIQKAALHANKALFSFNAVALHAYQNYFLDLFIENSEPASHITSAILTFNNRTVPAGLHAYQDSATAQFGNCHHNWGQFAYLPADSTDKHLISENLLQALSDNWISTINDNWDIFDTNDMGHLYQQCQDLNLFNFASARFSSLYPDYAQQGWISVYGVSVDKSIMSNYNNLLKITSAIPQKKGIDPIVAVRRQTYSETGTMTWYATSRKDEPKTGVATTGGWSEVRSDFLDMNGDLYPDVLSKDAINYTKPQGGLSDLKKGHHGIEQSSISGIGSVLNVEKNLGSADGMSSLKIPWKAYAITTGSLSVGACFPDKKFVLKDINGDELPDRIYDNGIIHYNLGYKFLATNHEPFNDREANFYASSVTGAINDTAASMYRSDYEQQQADASAPNITDDLIHFVTQDIHYLINRNKGESRSFGLNEKPFLLIDLNNDNLTDMLYEDDNQNIYVKYNLGAAYSVPMPVLPAERLSESYHYGLHSFNIRALGVSGDTDKGKVGSKMIIRTETHSTTSRKETNNTYQAINFIDMNGDGLPDYVKVKGDNKIAVRFNQGSKSNLLKSVTVKIDNSAVLTQTTIDYTLSPNTTDACKPMWTMSKVVVSGKEDAHRTEFKYEDAYYDRYERQNYGFATVKAIQYKNSTGYRFVTEKFHNRDYMRQGLKYYELLSADEAGEQKYVEKLFHYGLMNYNDGSPAGDGTQFCYGTGYPALDEEKVNWYNGNSTLQITTQKRYTYGPFGNVTTFYDDGDLADNNDNQRAEIAYFTDTYNLNIKSKPVDIKHYGGTTMYRHRTAQIAPATGQTTQIVQHNGSTASRLDYSYDVFGNVEEVICPANAQGQRMSYRYTYDPAVHQYPVETRDALGRASTSTYSYTWGSLLSTTDMNDNTIKYQYDHRGRLTVVKSPYDPDYTIRYYYNIDDPRWTKTDDADATFFKARTEHYDCFHPTTPITTYSFTDGFLCTQTKKSIVEEGVSKMRVSGKEIRDAVGRVTIQYDPLTEPVNSANNKKYTTITALYNPVTTTYDILDRVLSITDPQSHVTKFSYSFGNDAFGKKRFSSATTDANGHSSTVFTDSRSLKTSITDAQRGITKFTYNAIGELLSSIDPESLETKYSYDLLGRCIRRYHPDMGEDAYKYDPAGNMTERQTQKLINSNEKITYTYHYSQLTDITYPARYGSPSTDNVHYSYGEAGNSDHKALNAVGRILSQTDASGGQTFTYDPFGNVSINFRTFAIPNEPRTYTFIMAYEYDSWGRTKAIFYPDNEKVTYSYNTAGDLISMDGIKGGEHFNYIRNIIYNKFGQKTEIDYGNGTKAIYKYDNMQRLQYLDSYTASSEPMQNLYYSYDPVSNIIGTGNSAAPLRNGLGGSYSNIYRYDELNRLIHAESNSGTIYKLDMRYSLNGKISNKLLTATCNLNGRAGSLNCDRDYTYARGTNRLQMTNFDILGLPEGDYSHHYFTWDANGNMLTHDIPAKRDNTRTNIWDDENRLSYTSTEHNFGFYIYDASGERVAKQNGSMGQTNINGSWWWQPNTEASIIYASPYLVATPQGYTKHYYAGNDRIASKIGQGGIVDIAAIIQALLTNMGFWKKSLDVKWRKEFNALPPTVKQEFTCASLYDFRSIRGTEVEICYFHPDHLGSASWITDQDGKAIQHLQYLPFGETRLDQRTTRWSSRYTFSGKEKDEESGYSYFGARYYNSDLGIWLSPDPLSDQAPHQTPYAYCSNNPINRFDPNGMADWYANCYNSNGKWMDQGGYGSGYSYMYDWVQRTVAGREEVYYDRDVKSQADVNKKYGANSGVIHLKDGTRIGNGQYTVYNDHTNNINGVVKDVNGNVVNNDKTVLYGDNYTLFAGTTDNSVNPETLHQNWFGSSYIGTNNPKTYRGKDNYDYQPTWSPTEMAAFRHDKSYDALNARGVWGAISRRTKCADIRLINDCRQIISNPNASAFEKSRAGKMTKGFSTIIFLFKTPHY